MSRGEDPHVAQSSHFLCGMGIPCPLFNGFLPVGHSLTA